MKYALWRQRLLPPKLRRVAVRLAQDTPFDAPKGCPEQAPVFRGAPKPVRADIASTTMQYPGERGGKTGSGEETRPNTQYILHPWNPLEEVPPLLSTTSQSRVYTEC